MGRDCWSFERSQSTGSDPKGSFGNHREQLGSGPGIDFPEATVDESHFGTDARSKDP